MSYNYVTIFLTIYSLQENIKLASKY